MRYSPADARELHFRVLRRGRCGTSLRSTSHRHTSVAPPPGCLDRECPLVPLSGSSTKFRYGQSEKDLGGNGQCFLPFIRPLSCPVLWTEIRTYDLSHAVRRGTGRKKTE